MVSMKESGVQSPAQPQMPRAKFERIFVPSSVEDLRPLFRMEHLGVELDREGGLAHDLVGGVRDVGGLGDGHAPFRQAGDGVAVGHPHLGMDLDTVHERGIRTDDVQHRPAVFPGQGALDLAAAVVRDVLGAVADAQDRQLAFHTVQVELRGVGVADGTRAAGQDDTLHGVIQRRHFIKRKDLAIHIQLPQAAADQLGHLGAEVEDQDLIHRGNSWAFPW